MQRRTRGGSAVLSSLALAAAVTMGVHADKLPDSVFGQGRPAHAVALAVLGDSMSHSYQDELAFPPGSSERGGALRQRTFGWVEIVSALRGKELDPGPWVTWGSSRLAAMARGALGLEVGRAPRKQDHLYNFANSGAVCNDLMRGRYQQAPRLAALMDREPDRWREGIVIIRIGLNDWSRSLQLQAQNPHASEVNEAILRCSTRVSEAIDELRKRHPTVRILVVGIGNEIDDPGQFDNFRSAGEIRNIGIALSRFNGALRQLAERTPRAAFFDDEQWFLDRWGSRSPEGQPAYGVVRVGKDFRVTNTAGDAPDNAITADHHAGVVWNALWAQSLVARLKESFGLPLTPIADEELWRYLSPLVRPSASGDGATQIKAPGS